MLAGKQGEKGRVFLRLKEGVCNSTGSGKSIVVI